MDFRDQLNSSVPAEVQGGIVDVICAEYSHTHIEVNRSYAEEEARDVEPHIRRANIETSLLELAGRFPDHLTVASGVTQKNNHFRYLVCGKIVLTQSYIEPNRRVPRDAIFRNSFAGDPNQMLLDPDAESDRIAAIEAQELTYVIITHSRSLNNAAEPSHVTAVLVDANCHHVASVDLRENYAMLVSKNVPIECVEDRSQVTLRKDVGKKRATGA